MKKLISVALIVMMLLSVQNNTLLTHAITTRAGMINGIHIEVVKTGEWAQVAKYPDPALDLSSLQYLAIEFGNSTGTGWGFEVHLLDNSGKRASLFDGAPEKAAASDTIQIYDENYQGSSSFKAYYASVFTTPDFGGWLLIPRSALYGLESIDQTKIGGITLNFNCNKGNQEFEMEIGKVGWFSGKPNSSFSNLHLLYDPANMSDAQLNTDLLLDNGGGLVNFSRVIKNKKAALKTCKRVGDVKILEDMSEGYPTAENEWNKTLQSMVYTKGGGVIPTLYKDSDTDGNALKFSITGPVSGNQDYYSAVTFVAKTKLSDWRAWNDGKDGKKAQGVTFWAKNLSDYEVSMGFEIDEYDPGAKKDEYGERWSLQYGTRIMLYDTNTRQQYIVQSQPHFFIPVGFEGWVRVPFTFYTKAVWCTWGNGIMDLADIPQISIVSDSNINQGLEFVIDSLGIYYEETLVSTDFFNSGKSIPDQMKMN